MIVRSARAIAFLCLVLTGAAAVHVHWMQVPGALCPDDETVRSLPAYRAFGDRADPPRVSLHKWVGFRAVGKLPLHAIEAEWLRFIVGRSQFAGRYLLSGLALDPALSFPSDVTVHTTFESSGTVVPVTYHEHHAVTPRLVTGYVFLLDGEPVASPALAAVRRAIRAPLSPPAAITGISMGYRQSNLEMAQQKAEIAHWIDRFLVDIWESCGR
jgi:hypothetical protein